MNDNNDAWAGGCIGAMIGGIAIPIGLTVYAWLVLRDAGEPLFWPIFAAVGSLIGFGVGVFLMLVLRYFRR